MPPPAKRRASSSSGPPKKRRASGTPSPSSGSDSGFKGKRPAKKLTKKKGKTQGQSQQGGALAADELRQQEVSGAMELAHGRVPAGHPTC